MRRLDQPHVGATTGYRCLEPTRCTFANLLVYSINNFIVALYGAGGRHPIWGGSWAIRRNLFESVGLGAAWFGTLSEDFVATRVLHKAGLRVEFEPACMVASPLNSSLPQTMEFMRRQYMMGRLYTRFWFSVALFTSTVATLGFWGNFLALVHGWATQAAWTWFPGCVCLALYGLTSLRNGLRNSLVRRMLPETTPVSKAAARFDTWLGPITGLINWIGLSSAMLGHGVTWRGIHYEMSPEGKVLRMDDTAPSSCPAGLAAARTEAAPCSAPLANAPAETQAAVWQSVLSRSP